MSDSNKKISAEFRILRLESSGDLGGEVPKPHRHDFQEVIFIEKGKAIHNIDGENHELSSPSIILVAQGKMHLFTPKPNSTFYVIRFANEFLPEKYEGMFCQFVQFSKLPIVSKQVLDTITELLKMMYAHFNNGESNPTFNRHLLAALLAVIDSEREKLMIGNKQSVNGEYELFNKFLFYLETNFVQEKSVKFYAGKLNVSVKKLGEVSKEIFGDSPSRIIEKRAMLEAKRMLIYSNQTIQEITYELGYNDHSYFTKAFRKNEGLTPTEFRDKHKTE